MGQRISMPVLQSQQARAALGPVVVDALVATPFLHAGLLELLFEATPLVAARHALQLSAARGNRPYMIAIHFRAGNRSPQKWNDPPRHQMSELHQFLDCAAIVE